MTLGYSFVDGIATLTLDRPHRLNALDRTLLETLLDRLEELAGNPSVRAVVLTGAGRAFSAGGDRLAEGDDLVFRSGDAVADVGELRRLMRSSELLRDMPKVTLAAVNGPCAGAAFALACAADLRVAAPSAYFVSAFLPAGLSGDFGGTWTLPRIVGDARARELYLLSRRCSATRALEIGLVSEVFDEDVFSDSVDGLARDLAALPARAVELLKQNLNDARRVGFSEALDNEARRVYESAHSDDAEAATKVFRARRDKTSDGPG